MTSRELRRRLRGAWDCMGPWAAVLALMALGACSSGTAEQSLEPDGTDVTDGGGDDGSRGDDGGSDDGRGDDGSGDDGSGDDGSGDDGSGDDGSGDDGSGDDGSGDDGSGDDGSGDDGSGDDGSGDDGSGDDGSGDDGSGDDGGDDGDDDDTPDGPDGPDGDDGGNVGNGGLGESCEGHEHNPGSDRLVHAGAAAEGTTQIERIGSLYVMRFVGDEVIEYQLDVQEPAIQKGRVRVFEKTSASFPLAAAGPGFRTKSGSLQGPTFLENRTQLVSHQLTANGAALEYVDTVDGETFRRRHVFRLEGKSLRVRIVADATVGQQWAPNYAGIVTGPTERTFNVRPVVMQGTLSTPTAVFQNEGTFWFTASLLDLTKSHASDFRLPDPQAVDAQADSIDLGYDTLGLYSRNSAGDLMGPLDETLSVIVSRHLADVFVVPDQPISPFRSRLANRTVAHMANNTDVTWDEYEEHLTQLRSWGLDDLSVYFFYSWSASQLEGLQNVGPDWVPAKDEQNFIRMTDIALGHGFLVGVYTLFMAMPQTSPVYDDGDIVRTANGQAKTGTFEGGILFPLASDAGMLDDVQREARALRDRYGLNMAFVDVSTYGSPSHGASGDQIDQMENSGLSQTIERAILDRKAWMTALKEIVQGPILGESSIAKYDSNMEWIWAGYCDSTQRVVNTGSGLDVGEIPAGSPLGRSNWPVIPEYELRVVLPRQANHGNGFYKRFFGPSDSDDMFDDAAKSVVYPLTPAAIDEYRAYTITYGHTSYFTSNGPVNDGGNYMRQTDMLKEYYIGNALQNEYLNSRVADIHYFFDGQARTFEQHLFSTGDLESFRDPRLRIRFQSGFELFVNHAEEEWVIDVPGTTYTGDTRFVLPENGFFAYRPGTDFMALSGWAPGHATDRYDYVHVPDQYEFFDGRRSVDGYGNLTTKPSPDESGHRLIALKNHVRNMAMVQLPGGEFETVQGPLPQLVAVQISADKKNVVEDEVVGLRATARFDNGSSQDVSTQVEWTVGNDSIVHVTSGGTAVACRPGTTSVSALPYKGVAPTPLTLKVSAP